MYSMLIGLIATLGTSLALHFGAGLEYWIAGLVGLTVFAVVYFLLMRHVMGKVSDLMSTAQREIQANHAEKAIATMKSAYKWAPWQFYVKGQINSQIGTVYYLKRDFSTAFDYLEKGFIRHWPAMTMLGIIYMKRQKTGKMITTFDKAIGGARKEDLLYNVYAFCLDKVGERDKAIAVLQKGLKKANNTETMSANLEALQAGKKMKMKAYGEQWYQFHLEKPGAIIKQQTKAMQGRRKIVRR